MEWLESNGVRPRQARYQAALRPDIKCRIYSRAVRDSVATSTLDMISQRAKGFSSQGFRCSTCSARGLAERGRVLLEGGRGLWRNRSNLKLTARDPSSTTLQTPPSWRYSATNLA